MTYSAKTCDRVLRDLYKKDRPARCIGVDFAPLRKEILRDEGIQKGYAATGRGCGQVVIIGWAGASEARCGAELNSFGKVSVIKCEECGGDGTIWRKDKTL